MNAGEFLYDFGIIAFETGLLILFAWKSFDKRFHSAAIFIFLTVLQFIRRGVIVETGAVSMIPSYCLDFIVIGFCYSGKIIKKISVLVLFYALSFIFDTASYVFVSGAYNYLTYEIPRSDDVLHIIFPATAASKIMLIIALLIIAKSIRTEDTPAEWLRCLPTTLLNVVMFAFIEPYTLGAVKSGTIGLIMVICIACLLSNIFTIISIKRAGEKSRLTYRLEMTEAFKHQNETFAKDLSQAYDQIERTAHNLKNHLAYIETAPDLQSVKTYAQEIQGRSFPQIFELTGNMSVDAILSAKLNVGEDITVSVSGSLPLLIPWLDPVDVIIILGNALDNAIEACEQCGGGEINVTFKYNGWLLFSLENPVSSVPVPKKRGFGFVSSKGKGRGIGMESMKMSIERYDGNMQYEAEGGTFKLIVMLQPKIQK